MSNVDTKTVQTAYGDTTIEVVECDSCGAEVAKDDVVKFTLGDRDGWACEHCYDSGPVGFPEKVTEWSYPSYKNNGNIVALPFHTMFYPIVAPVHIIDAFKHNNEFVQGNATGIISTLVWVVISLLVYTMMVMV